MKRSILIHIRLLLVLMASYSWGTQASQNVSLSVQEPSLKDAEFYIHEDLGPLKRASELIWQGIHNLEERLKSEVWQEQISTEIFDIYAYLERVLDVFPLMYRDSLRETERKYRDDARLSEIVNEYSEHYRTTPLTHTNYVVERLKEARDLFADVRAWLRHANGLMVSSDFVERLSFYTKISLPEYPGLERYLRQTARTLLDRTEKLRSLLKIRQEVPQQPAVTASQVAFSTGERDREIGKIRDAFVLLERQNRRLFELSAQIKRVLQKAPFSSEDVELLVRLYQEFCRVLYHEQEGLKKEIDAIAVSRLEDSTLHAVKSQFIRDYRELHSNFVRQDEQFRRQQFGDLANVERVLKVSNQQMETYLARQSEMRLANIFKSSICSEENVENIAHLLLWTSSHPQLQEAVRQKAYELLENMQKIAFDQNISWIVQTTCAFLLLEQEVRDNAQRNSTKSDLMELRDNVKKTHTPFVRFKSQLLRAIDDLIRVSV